MALLNHNEPYSEDYLQDILSSVKTIAMVGASPDKTKFSYGVLRVLHETGYDMIPVNPRPELKEIRGLKVYSSLDKIDRPVDMVEVFRKPEDLYGIAEEAIAIGAKVLWGQIGVINHKAARLAEEAGLKVVIEKFLKGEEISFIAISDGQNILPLASSQDHKRRDNNNLVPNTGVMGANSTASQKKDELEQKVMSHIMAKTVQAMANQGTPYIGFLYAGLMMTDNHEPNVLEFNCRLEKLGMLVIRYRLSLMPLIDLILSLKTVGI